MTPDPYTALGLSHDATTAEIRSAYRKLALRYHPDRHVNSSQVKQKEASDRFAAISSAYSVLTDENKKGKYDHLYKFGAFDDAASSSDGPVSNNHHQNPRTTVNGSAPFVFKFMGRSVDTTSYPNSAFSHFSFGPMGVKKAPSRSSQSGGLTASRVCGFSFAFVSKSTNTTATGAKQYVHKTTQFINGKRYSKVETTTIHPDGRREINIEDSGNPEMTNDFSGGVYPEKDRCVGSVGEEGSVTQLPKTTPWYNNVWDCIREQAMMCSYPCGQGLPQ